MANYDDLGDEIQKSINHCITETVSVNEIFHNNILYEDLMSELRELATQAYLEGYSDH